MHRQCTTTRTTNMHRSSSLSSTSPSASPSLRANPTLLQRQDKIRYRLPRDALYAAHCIPFRRVLPTFWSRTTVMDTPSCASLRAGFGFGAAMFELSTCPAHTRSVTRSHPLHPLQRLAGGRLIVGVGCAPPIGLCRWRTRSRTQRSASQSRLKRTWGNRCGVEGILGQKPFSCCCSARAGLTIGSPSLLVLQDPATPTRPCRMRRGARAASECPPCLIPTPTRVLRLGFRM
jgi:hypothetical protein